MEQLFLWNKHSYPCSEPSNGSMKKKYKVSNSRFQAIEWLNN